MPKRGEVWQVDFGIVLIELIVLSITDYEKLLEDLNDLAAIAERRDEPAIPHEQFKAELKRDGIL